MAPIEDHPLRYQLVNELHARPFPVLNAPCRAAYLAIKQAENAAARDRGADFAHLLELLDRYAAPHPDPGATHYFGALGKYHLKWESHTEFVTYTIFGDGVADKPFDASTFSVFPEDWLKKAPGARITSALIRVEETETEDGIVEKADDWFVGEALAISHVLDKTAIIASDFRLDSAGHMRFAVFARKSTGAQRVGRIVQRLCEIETYKTMSMLGLTRSRALGPRMGAIDNELTTLMGDMTSTSTGGAEGTLKALLAISSELENMLTKTSFRFGATDAYRALVTQRIAVLREERFNGLQTFGEFMNRRFDPAMRTVKSTEARLQSMSDRALRAGNLLRTRVDVERSAQNQALLESMDKRADLQLRLQRTVEGLSVVAISYYAVSLAAYMLYPLIEPMGVTQGVGTAIVTPIVVLIVWLLVRRIRNSIH